MLARAKSIAGKNDPRNQFQVDERCLPIVQLRERTSWQCGCGPITSSVEIATLLTLCDFCALLRKWESEG